MSYAHVNELKILRPVGPWVTKSSAKLTVLFAFQHDDFNKEFFQYDTAELENVGKDIRGLRIYTVDDIKKNCVGANEWHKIRQEILFCTSGSLNIELVDVYGSKRRVNLSKHEGIWIQPYVLHTYTAIQDMSSLEVIANTLYVPEDVITHDTFSADDFHGLIKTYNNG